MPATLMLGRDVRGASDAGQACPVLCSKAPRCRTALRVSWTPPRLGMPERRALRPHEVQALGGI
jgi:hypothetical protein